MKISNGERLALSRLSSNVNILLFPILPVLDNRQLRRCSTVTKDAKRKGLKDIPGPRSIIPGTGTSWIFSIFGPYSKENCLSYAREDMFRKYGPIYKEQVGGATLVSIHSPQHIGAVMQLQGRIPIRIPTEASVYCRKQRPEYYKSVGLVNSGGEEWLDLRRKVNPAVFNVNGINTFIPQVNDIGNDFVKLLTREKDSRDTIQDIKLHLYQYGLEVIWMCLFGERLNCLGSELSEEVKTLLRSNEDQFFAISQLNMGRPWWKLFATPAFKLLQKSEDNIFLTVNKYTQPKIKEMEKSCPFSEEENDLKNYKTIVERFLADKTFDRKDVNSVCVDLVASGVFTTAYTLALFLHRLGREAEAQKRLQAQLDIAFASDPNTIPMDIHKKAPLLKATIKEGFRVASIIPCVVRLLDKPVILDDYEIPPYTPILCQIRAAGLSEAFFTSPKEFVPERWIRKYDPSSEFANLAKEAKSLNRLVIPFGMGSRMCVGERLVQIELWILLSKILYNFTVVSEGEIHMKSTFILAPDSPIKLKFIPRRSENSSSDSLNEDIQLNQPINQSAFSSL